MTLLPSQMTLDPWNPYGRRNLTPPSCPLILMYREDMHLNPQIKTQKLKVEAQYLMFSSPSQDDKREFTNLAKPLRTHSHKLGMWHCG